MNWWERRQQRIQKEKEAERVSWDLFKFQRPLFTTEAHPKILAYNSFRSQYFQLPYTGEQDWDELFRGQPKVYAWGRLDPNPDGSFHFTFDQTREPIRDPKEFPEW